MSLKFSIDRAQLRRGVAQLNQQIRAVAETIDPGGRAEVNASRRKKLPGERGQKVLHGRAIWNILYRQGHDPADVGDERYRFIADFLSDEINDAIDDAYRTGRPQKDRVKRALIAGAQELAEAVKERIERGDLGTLSRKYVARKWGLVQRGIASSDYGRVPPFGILTGRFIEGIRFYWRRGYRPGARR